MAGRLPVVGTDSPRSIMWPFLVGSGKTAPQQVILAPEFMIASQITALLLLATGSADVFRTDSQSSTAWRCQIRNGQVNEFSIIFRVIRAGPELVDAPGDFLLDDTSRPVYLAEGVVVIGVTTQIPDAVLREAHAVTTGAFREFWADDGRRGSPKISEPLPEAANHLRAESLIITELPAITYSSPVTLSAPLPEDRTTFLQQPRPTSEQPTTPVQPQDAQADPPDYDPRIITIGPATLTVIAVLIAAGIALLIYFLAA
jgi:hypothetical protein